MQFECKFIKEYKLLVACMNIQPFISSPLRIKILGLLVADWISCVLEFRIEPRCGFIAETFTGEESDASPGTPSSVYLRVNRRRTDLMPTIPSPRDGPPSSGRSSSSKTFTRSPGRTYSMSRLDQLSIPRKRPTELSTLTEQQAAQPLGASSMSRSMCHLAASGAKNLKRSDNSRSMGTLPGSVPIPRPTRAERLRRKAREYQNHHQPGKHVRVHSTPSDRLLIILFDSIQQSISAHSISRENIKSCFKYSYAFHYKGKDSQYNHYKKIF